MKLTIFQRRQQQHCTTMVSFLLRPSSWTRSRKSAKKPRHDNMLKSLAEQGNFYKFLKRLKEMDNERFLEHFRIYHSTTNDDDNKEENKNKTCRSSILHVALAHRAPLCIVETLLDRIQECCCSSAGAGAGDVLALVVPEEIQDEAGRTPLHVAVECGCDVNVIERLLHGETLIAPTYTKDKLGRYPLHWACCLPHKPSSSKEKRSKQQKNNSATAGCGSNNNYYYQGKKEVRRETIFLLLNAYPVAVLVPDIYGMTPLDYARSHLDPHTMQALVKVAQVHGDIKFLAAPAAARTASKVVRVTSATFTTCNNKRFSPMSSSPNSSETTERESTDNDSAVGDDLEEDVISGLFEEGGMLPFGELLLLQMDDLSSVGTSSREEEEENETVEEPSSPMTVNEVATLLLSMLS